MNEIERESVRPMTEVFNMESWLYAQKDKPIEIKAALYWGALRVACSTKAIDWDTQRLLFGEYMSKQLNLR